MVGLTLLFCHASAQNQEPIILIDGVYYQSDVPLRVSTIRKIVAVYPPAYQEVKSGRSRITWGYILSTCGGISLGGGISSLVFGETSETLDPLTGIGMGIVMGVGGGLLVRSGARRFVNGIEIYNSHLTSGYDPGGVTVNFGLADHGIGLAVTF